MTTPNWMPLNVADYLKDTRHLSTREHGAYFLLLMHAWTGGGELPVDETRLARIAGMSPKEWRYSREIILDFFVLVGNSYRHKRIDAELARADEFIEQKRSAGKASAAARAQRTLNGRSTDVPTGTPTERQREANQIQIQSTNAKALGGEPPGDQVKSLFEAGVGLLTKTGFTAGTARSLIGKWRKAQSDETVAAAIADAKRLEISDPKAWITARLAKAANDSSDFYASIDRTFGAAQQGR